MARVVALIVLCFAMVGPLAAQDLTFATVSRPPFSMAQGEDHIGFSIDLMRAIAADLGQSVTFQRVDGFGDMLSLAQSGQVDGAIANISITAAREEVMDFSLPIFESGLQIMVTQSEGASIFKALFTLDILLAVVIAVAALFGGGMLMWVFERRRQEYFDRPAQEAMFPAFWWALNLVVNGGFEERMPRSPAGRVFAVLLVVASLFIVSVFVAKITAAMTVEAIQTQVDSLNDIEGRRVGTVAGSTAANYLTDRGIGFRSFAGLTDLTDAFEAEQLDAVVFDGPILAYYLQTSPDVNARLVERVFRSEDYGIALPSGSPLREEINQSLLKLREDGTFEELRVKWFGVR